MRDIDPRTPKPVAAVGDVVYYFADDGEHGEEVWRTDGTPAGTWMLKDINPGSASAKAMFDEPNGVAVGDTLFFAANNGPNGRELWKSDGTPAGTVMVKNLTPDSFNPVGTDITAMT